MNIYTKRTQITILTLSDFDEIIDMYFEPDSFKYIQPLANKSSSFYIDFLLKKITINKAQTGFWTVRDIKTQEFIGTVNLNQFAQTDMIQIGCHLKRNYWNQGYASELLKSILKYGIEDRKLTEIFGIFEENNQVSKRLLKKLDFKLHAIRNMMDSKVHIYKYNTFEHLSTK